MRARDVSAVICLVALAGCRGEGPEARLRKAFADGVHALEAGDAAGAAALLSPEFQGPEGMDRSGARFFLQAVFRKEKVGVTVVFQKTEIQGTRAVQSVDLILTGRTGGSLVPAEEARHSLVIRWELRDRAWLIRELQEN